MLPNFNIQKIAKKLKIKREAELEAIIKTLARNPMKKPKLKPTVLSDTKGIIVFLQNHVSFSPKTLRELVRVSGSAVLGASSLSKHWVFDKDEMMIQLAYFSKGPLKFKSHDISDSIEIKPVNYEEKPNDGSIFTVIERIDDWNQIAKEYGFVNKKGGCDIELWSHSTLGTKVHCVVSKVLNKRYKYDDRDYTENRTIQSFSTSNYKRITYYTMTYSPFRRVTNMSIEYSVLLSHPYVQCNDEEFSRWVCFDEIPWKTQEDILEYIYEEENGFGGDADALDKLFSTLYNGGSIYFDKDVSIPLVDYELLHDSAKKELKDLQSRGLIDVA